MNRSDLIRKVSRKSGLQEPEVEKILNLILETIQESLSCGESILIKNFGRFETRERAATVRRNPKSGIDIKVPKKRGVLFRPSPALKQNVQREDTAYE